MRTLEFFQREEEHRHAGNGEARPPWMAEVLETHDCMEKVRPAVERLAWAMQEVD